MSPAPRSPRQRTTRKAGSTEDGSVEIDLEPKVGRKPPVVPMGPPPVEIDLEPLIGKDPPVTYRMRDPRRDADG